MQTIQVGELKAQFSDILEKVEKSGETFVIEYGKRRKKVAMLVPFREEKKSRKFGQLKGKIVVPDNFDDESEEIDAMFYGG